MGSEVKPPGLRVFIYEATDLNWFGPHKPTLFQFDVYAFTPHEAEVKATTIAIHKNGGEACGLRFQAERQP